MKEENVHFIECKKYLGIEFGSTRIKSVLISDDFQTLGVGVCDWENDYIDGYWTYSIEKIIKGLQDSFRDLSNKIFEKYGIIITTVNGIGISAMMHGYMPFDKNWRLLSPFRTWRNTNTQVSAEKLSSMFQFNIPQRWTIAHLYQAMLDKEPHVKDIKHVTTLAGYIHNLLTGKNVVGVGEASGIFPIDDKTLQYDENKIVLFNNESKRLGESWDVRDILPQILIAGENAGELTEEGARLIDPTGKLKSGVPVCPPEGDAGTGMVATNSIVPRTGNFSAGTSGFAMIVLEEPLSKSYSEIDMVSTPDGKPAAMVHCNTFTSDIDAWVNLFSEVASIMGVSCSDSELYSRLFAISESGDERLGSLLHYNCIAGEPIAKLNKGIPMFLRMPDNNMTLANFMKSLLFSAFGVIRIGLDILTKRENVEIDKLYVHGGFYKTPGTSAEITSAAFGVPITLFESAGEGGAWGMSILAAYMSLKGKESLPEFLNNRVFNGLSQKTILPQKKDVDDFETYFKSYKKGLKVENLAAEVF